MKIANSGSECFAMRLGSLARGSQLAFIIHSPETYNRPLLSFLTDLLKAACCLVCWHWAYIIFFLSVGWGSCGCPPGPPGRQVRRQLKQGQERGRLGDHLKLRKDDQIKFKTIWNYFSPELKRGLLRSPSPKGWGWKRECLGKYKYFFYISKLYSA